MAPRGRRHRKKMVGNTRLDAAMDAMRPFGFKEQLVEETIDELLDVYDGAQGWPFIEEASYKLLIETILGKQGSAEEKDNTRRNGVTEASSTATPETGITEVCSPGPVAQNSASCASDVLDSSSQANDHERTALGNLETGNKNTTLATDIGQHGQDIRVESRSEVKSTDNVKGSNNNMFVNNIASTSVKLPCRRRKPCYGWIDDSDEDMKLVEFPVPPLAKQLEKLVCLGEVPQSGSRRRRKSRWDEKPDDWEQIYVQRC